MPRLNPKRELDALIKATEDNRASLQKTQLRLEALEAAIQAQRNSRLESERKRGKRSSN